MFRTILVATSVVACIALGACDGRKAKVETPKAEAEVSTKLSKEVLSDAELNALATAAAVSASSPSANAAASNTTGNTLVEISP